MDLSWEQSITTITNDTTHVLRMSEWGCVRNIDIIPNLRPGMKFDFNSWERFKDTYTYDCVIRRVGDPSSKFLLLCEDVYDYREISVRTATSGSEIWIGTKLRSGQSLNQVLINP